MKYSKNLIFIFLLFISCSLLSLTAWKISASRERLLKEMTVHGLNLTQALSTYTEGIVRQSSLILLELVERLETDGSGPEQIERARLLIQNQQALMPKLSGVTITDKQGQWLLSTNFPITPNIKSDDRSYFAHHRNNPSREIFIGPPIKSRSPNKEWIVTISRRFNDAHGGFAGVIVITLSIENFLQLFGKIDVGKDGAIALTYTDGAMLVRSPFREQDMDRNFSNSPIYTKYLVNQSTGTASLTSTLDGVERFYVFRKSDQLPIITTVALGRNEALADWQVEALLSVAVVTSLIGFTGMIGWFLIVDIRKRNAAENLLLKNQQQLISSNQQLESFAMKDALTGLANRRCFDEILLTEARRGHREKTSLTLLMIDIDYFKLFNDSYGHLEGDACLQAVSLILESCVNRSSDLVARYGGEEMAIIMPNTDETGGVAVARLILDRLQVECIPHKASPLKRVSVSIGVVTATGPQLDNLQNLMQVTDKALYEAKTLGRNQFVKGHFE